MDQDQLNDLTLIQRIEVKLFAVRRDVKWRSSEDLKKMFQFKLGEEDFRCTLVFQCSVKRAELASRVVLHGSHPTSSGVFPFSAETQCDQ